jgi:hypothetical protein
MPCTPPSGSSADPAVLDAQNCNIIRIRGDQHRAIIHALRCRAGLRQRSRNRAIWAMAASRSSGFAGWRIFSFSSARRPCTYWTAPQSQRMAFSSTSGGLGISFERHGHDLGSSGCLVAVGGCAGVLGAGAEVRMVRTETSRVLAATAALGLSPASVSVSQGQVSSKSSLVPVARRLGALH